ncbi:hypothetical protein NLJ89_g9040 [Agrocybe chaxingu]|uniref:MYND-type domain-containing protein n=1 Tax=Agrocybe chaxingu TaxID=84603 RepID=A0A9W8MTX5_9AGAR|nr:hypothetical protein NLJ89_g9040 [Agrocybe chaxingu]
MPNDHDHTHDEDPEYARKIYLPLDKLDKCAVCAKTQGLKWCVSCGEILYCSVECQKKDWKSHKSKCGQTDRIDLTAYYPFIACTIMACHMHPDIQHPALRHQIVNSPNPYSGDIVDFPNGVSAKLVLLGDQIAMEDLASPKWWPTAESPKVRSKLMRRIAYEGLLLPILLATTIALVSEIYTTTAIPPGQPLYYQLTDRRRVRLSYNKAPIVDFGIAKGPSIRVTAQDRLAYYNLETNEFLMGQDPLDHYWIYFTTLNGHEYYLDCGMFTFNFCHMVADGEKYCRYGLPSLDYVPAFFYNQEMEKVLPLDSDKIGWKAKERFSILRNPDLIKTLKFPQLEYCSHDEHLVRSLMDKIAGRTCTAWEKKMVMTFLPNTCMILRLNMQNREYMNFPKEPKVAIEVDPGERIAPETAEEEKEDRAYHQYIKKWTKKLRKGRITSQKWDAAFTKWRESPHEARMALAGASK